MWRSNYRVLENVSGFSYVSMFLVVVHMIPAWIITRKDSFELNMADNVVKVPYMDMFICWNPKRGRTTATYSSEPRDVVLHIQDICHPVPSSLLTKKGKHGIHLLCQPSRTYPTHRDRKRDFWFCACRSIQQYASKLSEQALNVAWIARLARKASDWVPGLYS